MARPWAVEGTKSALCMLGASMVMRGDHVILQVYEPP